MESSEVLGTWHLVTWTQEYDDGRRLAPMGDDAAGRITYGADGRMSVVITAADRPPFTTGGQWDADVAERARAYDTCLAYAGTYAVVGQTVEHRIEVSLFPGWVGVTQVRHARLDGDGLHLTARLEEGTPNARTARLSWRRPG